MGKLSRLQENILNIYQFRAASDIRSDRSLRLIFKNTMTTEKHYRIAPYTLAFTLYVV